MKPTIVCENFEAPGDLSDFMKEALGEVLRISPYESHLEAYIRQELADYLMTISINYPGGKFHTSTRNNDLRRVITQSTANIFTQVRRWWKSRFGNEETSDWTGRSPTAAVPPKETAGDQPDPHPDSLRVEPASIGNIELGPFHDVSTPHGKIIPATDQTIALPGKPSKASPAQWARGTHRPLRVLVVDDDIESVTPLELCLEKLGCSTFIVNNGFEAIHEIISKDRVYDVIILDWNMPEMNGGQALLNAQKVIAHAPSSTNHWENAKLPVITYSSRGRDEIELPPCRDFRHLDHWEKPSSYLHLLDQATETFSKLNQGLAPNESVG